MSDFSRRDFLATSTIASASAIFAASAQAQTKGQADTSSETKPFGLRYAPHFGMFRHHGGDMLGQLKFAASEGFTAWEDNGMMRRSVEDQTAIAKTMADLGMEMGVFVADADFGTTKYVDGGEDNIKKCVDKAKACVEVAKRVNATWVTIVPGKLNDKLEYDYQMANCIRALKAMSQVLEDHGVVMVLEPLNAYANHPWQFLKGVPQAYLICEAVDSPSCKILDDLYHQQITEGHLISNMEKAWAHIPYLQVGDNPGRKEPTTGEINYQNIFRWLKKRQFGGIVGMEHGNSVGGKEGERKLIDAYRWCDLD